MRGSSAVESYLYTEGGYLKQLNVGGTKRVAYARDAIGRVTDYTGYAADGTNWVSSTTYDQQGG